MVILKDKGTNGWYPVVIAGSGLNWMNHRKYMARSTGVKRCPKRGEFYLSGAIVEAYRAPNDLSTEFVIAEVYEVGIKPTIEVMPCRRIS